MDFEFNSQKELFMRVRPALRSKCSELNRLGFKNIKEFDIWNYLILKKWKFATGLMLSDIVSDIMNLECKRLVAKQTQTIVEDNEIIWGEGNGKEREKK